MTPSQGWSPDLNDRTAFLPVGRHRRGSLRPLWAAPLPLLDPLPDPGTRSSRQVYRPSPPQQQHHRLPRELNQARRLRPRPISSRREVQAQGCVLTSPCHGRSGARPRSEIAKGLVRGVVLAHASKHPPDLIPNGIYPTGLTPITQHPAFPLVTGQLVGLVGLEPAASSLSRMGRLSAMLSSLCAGRADP
jgi:hypothetical protein